ncbi:glycosyltransferase family 4 protein [Thermococcus sp. ES12]|uniref:glycosyltransferase family 4 protein n=1 Tax=Thermococcus sp. ES12 TaxID=1638246 RepID=UPI0014311676|nr:glycosyltransferase family 4 protein [Thermococcus sp. ES12]NJE77048.1 glycosyltransferase family 4 protein [Thermococcus sp. ES12]
MRILMVGHYPPHGGGVANHLDSLVGELRKRHEVHVLTYGPIEPRTFEAGLVHQVTVPPVYGIRGTTFALLGARKIRRLHEEFDFDLVHAHFIGTTSYAAVLAKGRTGLPLVVTAHGSDLEHTAKLTLGRFYVKRTLAEADAIIAVSHWLAVKASSLGAERVRVVPNGVRSLPSSGGKREYITFIGALRDYKSPETFIELAREFPDEKFLVVGEGPLRKKLQATAPSNVKFTGYRHDVDAVLARSKLLVLPSLREGFGLVVLEANSLGVPAVGRRVSAIPELIREGKNGLTFQSFDELVEAVKVLLKPKFNAKAGAIGRRIAGLYTWSAVAREVERVYEEVVG